MSPGSLAVPNLLETDPSDSWSYRQNARPLAPERAFCRGLPLSLVDLEELGQVVQEERGRRLMLH